LRGTSGGATIPTPGGAGTLWRASCNTPRARLIGFSHKVGALTLLGSGPSLCPAPMPQGWPARSFVVNGGRRSTAPHSPSARLSKHTPPPKTSPIWARKKSPICVIRCGHLGTIMSPLLGRAPPHSPLRGTATRLFSIGVGPVLWRRVFLMYARTTSLLKLYIRNIIPGDVGSSVRRPWPIGVGDWSELCIASGTFRETMGRRTGVSALRNPGGVRSPTYIRRGALIGLFGSRLCVQPENWLHGLPKDSHLADALASHPAIHFLTGQYERRRA